jgi:hypothetical protein
MKIFWAWQSDTPGKIGRFFVRDALRDAIAILKQAPDIEEPTARANREALHLDQDRQGVPGSPDLARTIFDKIDASKVVVADVTLVGQTADATDRAGNVELPFDLRHKGGAIVFELARSKLGKFDRLTAITSDIWQLRNVYEYNGPSRSAGGNLYGPENTSGVGVSCSLQMWNPQRCHCGAIASPVLG